MNKKILIILLCVIICIACSSLVLARFNKKEEKDTNNLNVEETIAIEDMHVKLDGVDTSENDYYISKSLEELNKLNIKTKLFDDAKIEYYRDNMRDITEVVISDSEKVIKMNKDSGELLSYIHLNTSFKENTLNREEVEKVAMELFNSFNKFENYKLYALDQFDEELYLAKYCKSYGDYINPGEMVSFSFSPEEKEIVNFARKSIPFANNEIKISMSEAYNLALPYLNASSATDMTIDIEIVELNNGLKPILNAGQVYKDATETRLAYVCKFNNKDKTIIYIDCTTGDIIGAFWILE